MPLVEWGELPFDDEHDDDLLPLAPLPAHERHWRHPSELGAATWVHTEPPISVGRGLLAATGAVGGLLALTVLWAMVPSAPDGSASSVVSVAADQIARVASSSSTLSATETTVVSTTFVAGDDALGSADTTPVSVASTLPATSGRPPHTTSATLWAATPVADGAAVYLITTSRAAEGRSSLRVVVDGTPTTATVSFVDVNQGVAVLNADAPIKHAYTVGATPLAGQHVTVSGSTSFDAVLRSDSDGYLVFEPFSDAAMEGAPVLNLDGQLVGLCSHGTTGPELVTISDLDSLRAGTAAASTTTTTTTTTTTAPPPPATAADGDAWLGVQFGDGHGTVISEISPGGPAATAGLVVGDQLISIGDAAVSSESDVRAALGTHQPGERLAVTVRHSDGTSATVSVVLAIRPGV